jgi:hypothetical protein
LSFFDDGEEEAREPATRVQRPRAPASGGGGGGRGPRPRRPQRAGARSGPDQRTLLIRRAAAAGVAIVIVIVIVLLISSALKSAKQESLRTYSSDVGKLGGESVEKISQPLFLALASAAGKKPLEVDEDVNQLSREAREQATRAQQLSVPGEMEGAQRDFLLTMHLRVEGLEKLATLLQTALGTKAKKSLAQIAGDMELFLASDVIYSQRVVALIQQTLAANSITNLTTASSRFLPNVGWLETSTVSSRLTGQATQSTTSTTGGHHGSLLTGVSVANNTLAAEPTLNHLSGGSSPTLTVQVEDDGEFPETDVKVNVVVTAEGKTIKGSGTIEKTEPGKMSSSEVKLSGVPTGSAAKVEAEVAPVPGETNHEDTKKSYLAIFE